MGGETSQQENLLKKKYSQHYELLKTVIDKRVGEITLFKHKYSKKLIACKEFRKPTSES